MPCRKITIDTVEIARPQERVFPPIYNFTVEPYRSFNCELRVIMLSITREIIPGVGVAFYFLIDVRTSLSTVE